MREALVAGHVVKRGEVRRAWRRRWMTLYRDGVLEYRAELGRPLRGTIDLRDVQRVVRSKECVCKDDWPHTPPKWPRMCAENTTFALITKHRTYYLYTFTPREAFTWIAQVERLQFEIAHERAAVPRPLSVSLDDTKGIRLPALLPETFVEQLSAALASPTSSTTRFGRASFTPRGSLLAAAITETGVPYGSEQECTATVLHVQYRDQGPLRSITLNTTPVTVEGVNFAGVLQIRRNDSEQPIEIYMPGEYTYDAGGASGTGANECMDAEAARFHTHISAVQIAAVLLGTTPLSLRELYEEFVCTVQRSTGRVLLHAWMHHQIEAALVQGTPPLSYGAFLHEVAEGKHERLRLDLRDEAHAHTRVYLASRENHDGQVPRQFFAVLTEKGMGLAQKIGLTQFRLLQHLSDAEGTEAVQSCNPVSAVFVGKAALQGALLCKRVYVSEEHAGCQWRVTPAGNAAQGWDDSGHTVATEGGNKQQEEREKNFQQGQEKKGKCVGTARGGQELMVRCWAPGRGVEDSDDEDDEGAARTDVHIALQQADGQSQREQAPAGASLFEKRHEIQLSFSAEDVELDGLNFAGAINLAPAASEDDRRRIVVPGERTYDLAGKGSDTRASERVAGASALFLTSMAACEALAAAFGANAREVAELHEAFASMNTAFHGRPTLGAWLHHQVQHTLLAPTTTKDHDQGASDMPLCAGPPDTLMPYPCFVRRTLDVSRLAPTSHVLQYLTSLERGEPQLPLAYLATCFKAENLGRVLPLKKARVLETLVREMHV